MKHNYLIYILVITGLFAGATYAASTLWGEIDEPVEVLPKKPVTLTPPPEAQKSTCEVLRQQVDLNKDSMASAKIQDTLRTNLQASSPEYKALLSDPSALNELYKQYRAEYLRKNCAKA